MDYIYFFYGLGFILMAGVCISLGRGKCSRLPWLWLGLFGITHGLNEWLNIATFYVGKFAAFEFFHVFLLVASYLCLMEFARRSVPNNSNSIYTVIIYTLAVLGILAVEDMGFVAMSAVARYALGFPGAALAGYVLLTTSAHFEEGKGRWLVLLGIVFLLYAITSGLIVPNAPFLPASLLNYDGFRNFFGFPIQLVRGLLSISSACFMWMFYYSMFPSISDFRAGGKMGVFTLAAIGAILGVGWVVTNRAGSTSDAEFRCNLKCETQTAVAAIDPKWLINLKSESAWQRKQALGNLERAVDRINAIKCDEEMYFHGIALFCLKDGRLEYLLDEKQSDKSASHLKGDSFNRSLKDLEALIAGKTDYLAPPIVDDRQKYISSYASVRDPISGSNLAFLELQTSPEEWVWAANSHRLATIVTILLLCVIVVIFSVSTQNTKATAMQLITSESKYRSLVESSKAVIAFFDREGRLTSINDAGAMALGVSVSDIIGVKIADFWPQCSQEVMAASLDSVVRGDRSNFEADYLHPDGHVLTFHAVLNPISSVNGKVESFAGIWTDITERKRIDDDLRESESRYRDLFENASDYILTLDLSGKIASINRIAEDGMGYSVSDGAVVKDFVAPEYLGLVSEMMRRKRDDEVSLTCYEVDIITKAGERKRVEVTSRLLRKDGEPAGYHIIARDVTERRRAAEALSWESQVNSAMADLSSAVLSMDSIESISELVLKHAMQITGSVYGFASHIDPQTKCLVQPVTSENANCVCMLDGDEIVCSKPMDFEGWDVQLHHSLLSNSPETRPGFINNLSNGVSLENMLLVPAMFRDEILGQIMIANSGRDYNDRDMSSIERLASLYAIAIRRKRAEDESHIQASAINAATDQIVITDINGNIEFVNPAFERETGYACYEVLHQNPRVLKSGKHDDAFYSQLWKTILSGKSWYGELTNRRKDGTLYMEDICITPVKNEKGELQRFVAIKRNVTEKKQFEARLDYLAYYDPLTGLPNRLLFSDRLTQRLAYASSTGHELAVMFLDVDRFKLINDTLGHNIGDSLLKSIAARLQHCLRGADTIARMGGDEFAVILSDSRNQEEVVGIATRVIDSMREPFQLDGRELFTSVSIGISTYPADGADAETLVKNADTAMYRIKEYGRNGYQLFNEAFNKADLERMALENGLRKALQRNEFVLHYQPQVDMATGEILGVESLVRWQHPELGMVPPGRFIPLAEETGLISPIGKWVMRAACAQNKAWQDEGLAPIVVAVNVSAHQLQQQDLVDTVSEVLAETGLDPQYLELELTESTLMDNTESAIDILTVLKGMGVKISIDDFGTGYSSLSYLKRFPIDSVKIDQSFIRDITTNPDDAAIAGAVIAMAHSLKLNVIAEGVETVEQLDFLRSLKCNEVQGYFISRPVPAEDFQLLMLTAHNVSASGATAFSIGNS